MKLVGGGAAGLGAAAMMPSMASAFKIESDQALQYFNKTAQNPNFEVRTSGNLDLHSHDITNVGSVEASSVSPKQVGNNGGVWVDATQFSGDDIGAQIKNARDHLHNNFQGGTIFVPAGSYTLSTKIDGSLDAINIVGAGIKATKIEAADGFNANGIDWQPTSAEKWFGLRHIVWDGNKANNTSGHGIISSNDNGDVPGEGRLQDVIIQNWAERGIYCKNNAFGWRFVNCWAEFNGTDGAYINGSNVGYANFHCASNQERGLVLFGGASAQHRGNINIRNNGQAGSFDGMQSEVSDSVLAVSTIDNSEDGLFLNGGTGSVYMVAAENNTNNGIRVNGTRHRVMASSRNNGTDYVETGGADRCVVNGRLFGRETLTLAGNENKSPGVAPTDTIPFLIDAGGTANRELEGIGGAIRRDEQTVRIIHTGGEAVDLPHDDANGTDPLINQSGATDTLSTNGDMAEYVYSTQANKWVQTALVTQ